MSNPIIARKRPTTVEAWYWDGRDDTADVIVDWIESNKGFAEKHPNEALIVLGDQIEAVKPHHWVVRDQFGDFYPLPDGIFRTVYATSF